MELTNISASRLNRLAATIIDCVVLFGIVGTIVAIGGIDNKSKLLENIGISSILFIMIIQLFLLSKYGQTVGKMIMKIKIVRYSDLSNGGFVTNVLARGLIHAASITVIVPIIDISFIFSKSKQCLHDKIAGTIVVQSNLLPIQGSPATKDQPKKKQSDYILVIFGFVLIGGPVLFGFFYELVHTIVIVIASDFHEPLKVVSLPALYSHLLSIAKISCGFAAGYIYKKYSKHFTYQNIFVIIFISVFLQFFYFKRTYGLLLSILLSIIFIASPFLGTIIYKNIKPISSNNL